MKVTLLLIGSSNPYPYLPLNHEHSQTQMGLCNTQECIRQVTIHIIEAYYKLYPTQIPLTFQGILLLGNYFVQHFLKEIQAFDEPYKSHT